MSATHLHLLTNHVPIIGLLIGGVLAVLVAFVRNPDKQEFLRQLVAGLVLASAAIGHFSAEQGEAALQEYRQPRSLTSGRLDQIDIVIHPQANDDNRLQRHVEAAEAGHFSLPLLVLLCGLWLTGRWRGWMLLGSASVWWLLTLIIWGVWLWHGWVGYLGGQIRHLNL
jgi:hypothetical protein